MPAGAARNAIDCALWDLEAKRTGKRVWMLAGLAEPEPVETAYTLSVDTPAAMAAAARVNAARPLLKLKLTGPGDLDRVRAVRSGAPDAKERFRQAPVIVALIDLLVSDLLGASAARIEALAPAGIEDVREAANPSIVFSERIERERLLLKRFLRENLYHHSHVLRMTRKAEGVVADLYGLFRDNPGLLPLGVRRRFDLESEPRVIADYVAGMTDRFAMAEHRKLLDPHELV